MKQEYRQAMIDNFDPEEDIILPSSIWSEIRLIFCVLIEIMHYSPEERKKEIKYLKRQILIFFKWYRNK